MGGNLVVGAEGEEWRVQRVGGGQPLHLSGETSGDRPPIVCDFDDLDEDVQFDVPSAGGVPNDERLGVEPRWFHVGAMTVPVGQGLAEPGEADDVGMLGGVGEQATAAAASVSSGLQSLPT